MSALTVWRSAMVVGGLLALQSCSSGRASSSGGGGNGGAQAGASGVSGTAGTGGTAAAGSAGVGGAGSAGAAGAAGSSNPLAGLTPGLEVLAQTQGDVWSMLLDGDSLYYTLNNTALMRMPKAGGASELVLQGHGTWNRPNITVFGRDLVFVGGDSLIRYNLDTGATASIPWDFRAPVDHIGSAAVAGDRLVVMRGECNDILVYDASWTEQLHVVVHTEDYMGGVISNFHVDGDVAWCASSQHMKLFKINLLTGESQVWLTLNKNDAQGLINGFRAAFTLGTDLFAAIGMINEPGVYRWARVPGQGTYEMVGPDVPVGAGNTAWDSTTRTLWSVGGAITRWSPTTLKVFKADLKLTTHGSPESIDTGVLADTYAYFYFSDGLNPNPAEVKRIFRIKRDAIPWVEQTAVSFLWAPP